MQVSWAQLGPPIDLRASFAARRSRLVDLLQSLAPTDWEAPTACDGWTVADLRRHVLGDLLGRVSALRDDHQGKSPRPDETIGSFIDRVNEEWVVAARQLSPALVVELYATVGPIHDELWLARDLDEPSLGVSWAGVDPAPLWFDAARDVTEYWLHEQQLRAAVGAPAGGVPDVDTIIDVFARGLPFTLGTRSVPARSFVLTVEPSGASWRLRDDGGHWWLDPVDESPVTGDVSFSADLLWRRWARQGEVAAPVRDATARAVWDHVAIVHSAPDT